MAVTKLIELIANSAKSWEDATRQAVHEASKTLYNIRSVSIREQCAVVEHGQITSYQVTVELSFEIEDS